MLPLLYEEFDVKVVSKFSLKNVFRDLWLVPQCTGYQFGGRCSLGDEQSPERKVMNTHLKAEGLNPSTDTGFC